MIRNNFFPFVHLALTYTLFPLATAASIFVGCSELHIMFWIITQRNIEIFGCGPPL